MTELIDRIHVNWYYSGIHPIERCIYGSDVFVFAGLIPVSFFPAPKARFIVLLDSYHHDWQFSSMFGQLGTLY